ncbi:MAG: MerR family transcriptional regulator [Bacillota bacterium]|nr:MerR family transcriptional regulator [Bacillota bacterium]
MALLNCKKCNRLFASDHGETLCSRCNEVTDDGFSKAREFIYDNPQSSLKDVSEGTGVEVDAILKWIREGRIVLTSQSGIRLCQRCGDPMLSGKYCDKCTAELKSSLTLEEETPKEHRGMFTKKR